jgi:hypothetical protein
MRTTLTFTMLLLISALTSVTFAQGSPNPVIRDKNRMR